MNECIFIMRFSLVAIADFENNRSSFSLKGMLVLYPRFVMRDGLPLDVLNKILRLAEQMKQEVADFFFLERVELSS